MTEDYKRVISETLASGVEPISRKYSGVYDGYGEEPIAYFTETEIFTAASGIVSGYRAAIDDNEIGVRFSLSGISSAYEANVRLNESDKRVYFITADITKSFLTGDTAKLLDGLVKRGVNGDGICRTFTEKAITDGKDAAINGNADARGMGFKTAINAFGGELPLSVLMRTPVDYLFLSPQFTATLRWRDTKGAFTAFTGLLGALRIRAVLCGVKDDDAIRDATAAECFGIVPAADYKGQFSYSERGKDLKDILSYGVNAL